MTGSIAYSFLLGDRLGHGAWCPLLVVKKPSTNGVTNKRMEDADIRSHLHCAAFPGTARQGRCGAVQVFVDIRGWTVLMDIFYP